jgi:peptide/nickel transport system ATP-binding protein
VTTIEVQERPVSGGTGGPDALVAVRDLVREFDVSAPWLQRTLTGEHRRIVKAVSGVSFDIRRGETLALVGESGSGKSTIARMVVGLLPPTGGSVRIDGTDIWDAGSAAELQRLRRRFQMIFQDPFASLNPRWRVRDIIAEPLQIFGLTGSGAESRARVGELLTLVKLTPEDGEKYPHQFSGGQRQRISIARALASEPEFLVCDEPTSALDVSVQAQILNLLLDLRREFGLTYVFISHNLAVVEHIATQVAVMYLGRVVEQAETATLFSQPRHPYTQALLASVLTPEPGLGIPDTGLGLAFPDPLNPPSGCPFHPRCAQRLPECDTRAPVLADSALGKVACHLHPTASSLKTGITQ